MVSQLTFQVRDVASMAVIPSLEPYYVLPQFKSTSHTLIALTWIILIEDRIELEEILAIFFILSSMAFQTFDVGQIFKFSVIQNFHSLI